MNRLIVNTTLSSYPIYINDTYGGQGLITAFTDAGLSGRKFCIVSDRNVSGLYLDEVHEIIAQIASDVSCCTFDAGEEYKNLDTIQHFYKFFIENRLDRRSVIVALGGGVTGDMAGYAASGYMRGIPFVQLPTTLLSQVDASVGGKVGVDFMGYKNMIGAFYQPAFVYINTRSLNTLPPEQFSSGMGEVVKHGLIMDKSYYRYVLDERERIAALDAQAIERIVSGSCEIKAAVVSEDEKEQGKRELLNFGHTFGHAVESLSDFMIPHGHCVACGMSAALYISCQMGRITLEELSQAQELFRYFGMPVKARFSPNSIYERMFKDKKVRDNQIRYVLLDQIGRAVVRQDIPSELVMEGIKFICM